MRSHTSRSRPWFLRIQDSNAASVRNVLIFTAESISRHHEAESLVTGVERKHEWPTAPLPAAGGRPIQLQASTACCDRVAPEHSTPDDAGLPNASGDTS